MNLRRLLHYVQNDQRAWPRYMPGGRVRTSTVGLLVAFVALFWLYQVYEPPPQNPTQQVVPPGFVPDPDYTWVPRTQVEAPATTTWRAPRTSTSTTTAPTTTSPTETTTTSPTSPTSTPPTSTPPTPTPPTTVIDPDGPGLLPPRTVTETPAPPAGPQPLPGLPLPPP